MRFVDQARIKVSSGHGGAGAVSYRREKFVPRGGPDGGDGGRGGDAVVEADAGLVTLYDFTHRRNFRAQAGQPGAGNQRSGRAGQELVVRVPCGTLIYDEDDGQLLADLVKPGQRLVAARGGRGGKGNKHFATAHNQTPRFAQPGEPGQERRLRLELKLLADVALVGLPNAGKSTLISRLSAARPKVAAYPFTTLTPNLGVVAPAERPPFVVADVPGLIEGASRGVGLGHQFLRHVERTRLLVFLLDAAERPGEALAVLQRELAAFNPKLAARERFIALNKMDLLRGQEPDLDRPGQGERIFRISALTGLGLEDLVLALSERLEDLAAPEVEP